jgi:16S rRNA (adenine1518-N6/adenine1519-N6)-dimethyltransferase
LLLEQAGHVLAIEKDGRLVQLLRERFSPSAVTLLKSHLELIEADALKYLRREAANWRGWSVVSNLPYSVASPILVELAQASPGPDRMVVTLQLEVARRLMAKAGEADYGILTLLVQVAYEPIEWFKIPATCFFPEPDVDSACVVLNRRSDAFCNNTERKVFNGIVKRSFSQRRKMMAKLLKVDWPVDRLNAAFTQAGLLNNVRAETVTLEQFVKLTRTLYERRDF